MPGEGVGAEDPREAWVSVYSGQISQTEGVPLPVLSGSMGPRFPVGGLLTVVAVPAAGSTVGDIIVFRDKHSLTAHRQLLRVSLGRRGWIYQKGDANARGAWIGSRRVVGVVAEARDSQGAVLYRREEHTMEARREAQRQLTKVLLRPARRAVRGWRKILTGRWSRHGA